MSRFIWRLRTTLLSVVLLSTLPAKAGSRETVREIENLLAVLESSYAPLSHKEAYLGWKWSDFRESALRSAAECKTSHEYYRLVSQILGGLKDAHVGIQIPSTLEASLDVQFLSAGGKIVVSHFSKKVGPEVCAAQPGDELISFDARPVEDAIKERIAKIGVGNAGADRALAAVTLGIRRQSRGDFGIEGLRGQSATLEFRKASADQIVSCKIPWQVTGHGLVDREISRPAEEMLSAFEKSLKPGAESLGWDGPEILPRKKFRLLREVLERAHDFAELRAERAVALTSAPFLSSNDKKDKGRGTKIELGAAKPYYPLPKDFKQIKLPIGAAFVLQGNIHAGTFNHGGKRVGYLRIGSYVPPLVEYSIFGLRQVIAKLEKNSDYLIVDQTFNPGGYVIYADWVVSALNGEFDEQKHLRFQFKPTQASVSSALALEAALEALVKDGDEKDLEWVKNNRRLQAALEMARQDFGLLKEAYQSGAALSKPVRLYHLSIAVEEIVSRFAGSAVGRVLNMMAGADISKTTRYTKPVYFFINEMDFSGGDATPAMLQDYGRVKLIGKNTAGAGGSVGGYGLHSADPFSFSLTESLMYRPGGKLVENYGVAPDAPFEMLPSDVATGFNGYLARMLAAAGL